MLNDLLNNPGTGLKPELNNLGSLLSGFYSIAFYLVTFLAFIWFVWGAFQYIFAGGDKEKLAKAKARLTWAVVGLVIFILAFVIAQFAAQILKPKPGNVPLPGFSLVQPAYGAVDIGKEYAFGDVASLGQGLDRLVGPAFSIATAAVIFYFLIGAFKILTGGGDKEALGNAQKMITHSIIGFILLMFAFLVFQFVLSSLFGITGLKIIK